jgi:hypothetical protein
MKDYTSNQQYGLYDGVLVNKPNALTKNQTMRRGIPENLSPERGKLSRPLTRY